jgi:hypothetical protein
MILLSEFSGRHSCSVRRQAKAAVERDELGGASVQPGTARAYARQPTTRMQAGGRWYRSRAEAAHRRCNLARRSCKRLRGCAGHASAAHIREQRKFNP